MSYAVGFKFKDGKSMYYTGKAGEGWLSEDPTKAFFGYNQDYAYRLGDRMLRGNVTLIDVEEVVTLHKE